MSGWVADVPDGILDSLYTRVDARPVGCASRSTLWRVCTDTDTDVLDAVTAEWAATQRPGPPEQGFASADTPKQVRLDGKTVRGAIDADGEHCTCCPPWWADRAWTRPPSSLPKHRPTAPKPANQPPPAATTTIGHESTVAGHGRVTRRTIRVLPAPPGLPFPHVNQVWLIDQRFTPGRAHRHH